MYIYVAPVDDLTDILAQGPVDPSSTTEFTFQLSRLGPYLLPSSSIRVALWTAHGSSVYSQVVYRWPPIAAAPTTRCRLAAGTVGDGAPLP